MANAPTKDAKWIARCIELAERGAGRTGSNPMVGSVVLDRRGRLVGEGYHRGPGTAHAEVVALRRAGAKAKGGTLYCNLEPCNHHGRTPPCAPHVAESGVIRVVFGMSDPIRGHGGGGRLLRRRGVDVTRGVLRKACVDVNRAWLTLVTDQRPRVTLKAAITLDGRIATSTGESKWITGPVARRHGHGLRASLHGIAVGIGTVLADDPLLTVRGKRGARNPVRIILDSRLRTPVTAQVLKGAGTRDRVIIATTPKAARGQRAQGLLSAGAEVWAIPGGRGRVNLPELMGRLGAEGIASLLVEGGAGIHGAFLDEDLADELYMYIAPKVFGGTGSNTGPAWVAGRGLQELAHARDFEFEREPCTLGDDVLLVATRRRKRQA